MKNLYKVILTNKIGGVKIKEIWLTKKEAEAMKMNKNVLKIEEVKKC